MKSIVAVLAVCVALASGDVAERSFQRIVGGSPTTINQYPYAVVVQRGTTSFFQWCGGSILTTTAVLTAAHCFQAQGAWLPASQFRLRVGSTFASSGGSTHFLSHYIAHQNFNPFTADNDIGVMRTSTAINYIPGTVWYVSLAGTNYIAPDNAAVRAIGWGATHNPNENPETLRHVQVYVINQAVCRQRYGANVITDGMLCSGVLDVGGRDQCQGDSGGPLLHNNVQIGVCSWGRECADPFYPGVNARVSSYTNWIINAAQS